mgnify:CR=1 FL=1
MAKTSKNNIYYNDDEDSIADVLADMKKLAESTDEAIENAKYNDKQIKQDIATLKTDNEKNKTNITNIEKKSTEQDKSISNNTKSIEELQAENKALKEENRIIKEQIPGAAASGNSIHLEDSSNLEMNWKIKDGHRQETREGYNLLDTSNVEEKEYDGVRVTRNSDGSIKFKGAATKDFAFTYSFEKALNGTYQESMQVIGTINDSTGFISSTIWNGGTNLFGDLMLKSNSTQILNKTFAENTNITHAMFYVATGAVLDCTIYPLLYKFDGTTKPYEQYGAMPSPDYPSEIETVGSNVNLLNNTLQSQTINGLKVTVNTDKSVTVVGTATDATPLIFDQSKATLPAGTYTVKDCGTFVESEENHGSWNSGETRTFTAEATLSGSGFYKYYGSGEEVNVTLYPKVEKGTVATPHSPHGIGSVKIDVVNKNLFPSVKSQSVESNGITFSYNADTQEFHAEGTTTSTNFYCDMSCGEMNFLKANKNYIFSVNNSIPEKCLFQITRANVGNNGDIHAGEKSVTIVNLDKYIPNSVMLYSSNIEIGTKIDYTFKVQIEERTTATDIVEHQSQTAIMPIQQEMLEGDYVTDVEHHEWKKIVLTGNENWIKGYEDGTERENLGFRVELEELKQIDKTQNYVLCGALCNYLKESLFFTNDISKEVWGNLNTFALSMSAQYTLAFNIGNINTVEELKNFLNSKYEAGTPVTISYKLATPIDLELTEEQKRVQNQKLYTYKNITNISVSDELSSIDVEYKKDQNAVNKNFENRLAALETASTSEEA